MSSLLLAIALTAAEPSKFDWPQWRGQQRDGVSKETGLLQTWPKEGPKVAWKISGIGGGYSSPAIAGGRIYGTGMKSGEELVWCLNESDGKEVWSKKFATPGRVSSGEGPRSTPTIDGDRLYCVGVTGDFVCMSTKDGSILWQKNFGKDFGGRMMSGWGYSESPLVDGDWVICTPGSDSAAIVALDKMKGTVVWKSEVKQCGGAGYSSIMKAEVGKTKMYITILGKSGGVVAVNAKNGEFLWRYTKMSNGTANIPTVLVRDDIVFCATGYGAGAAVLKLKETSEGKVVADEVKFHEGSKLQNHHGGMVLVGEYVYLGRAHNSGFPTCVEFKTGEITWAEGRGEGTGSAAIAYADGKVYLRYQSGTMVLMEANPKEYKVISKFTLPDNSGKPSWPHPVIANGKLYIRDQDKLICFDIKAVQ